jgi:hypothetical protein
MQKMTDEISWEFPSVKTLKRWILKIIQEYRNITIKRQRLELRE